MIPKEVKYYLLNNLEIILLSLSLCTLYFKENINSYFLVAYILYWVFNKNYNKINTEVLIRLKYYFFFVVLYLMIIVVGNIYSLNLIDANNILIKQFAILLCPILITHIEWNAKNRELFNGIFVGATFLFLIYLWSSVIIQIIELKSLYIVDPLHPTWKYYLFTSGRLSPEVHPTFLSIYITYSLFYIISKTKINRSINQKVKGYVLMLILTINLLLLSSRGALFSLLFVVFAYEVVKLIYIRNMYGLIKLGLIIITVALVFNNNSIFNRISKITNIYDKSLIEVAKIDNSIGNRAQVYLIANEIIKDNFWLGIGSKNWNEVNEEYYTLNFKNDFEFNIKDLNTHNQFLNSLISWGIIAPFLLAAVLFFQVKSSYKSRNTELWLFWCFFVLVLFTENILDRHRGIIFYSITSGFTMISLLKTKINER